jgi:hypothetical protein
MDLWIGDDTAPARHIVSACFELWLDEEHEIAAGFDRRCETVDECGEGNERHISHDEVLHVTDISKLEMAGVVPLDDRDSRITT